MVLNVVILSAEQLRWSGGEAPFVEVSIVSGHLLDPSVMETVTTPSADANPSMVAQSGISCYWLGARGVVASLMTPLEGVDTTGVRLRLRLLNRLYLKTHLVGETQVAIGSLEDGTFALELEKMKGQRRERAGILRCQIDLSGRIVPVVSALPGAIQGIGRSRSATFHTFSSPPSSQQQQGNYAVGVPVGQMPLSPQHRAMQQHQHQQQQQQRQVDETPISRLARQFEGVDIGMIQDVFESLNSDYSAAYSALSAMTGGGGGNGNGSGNNNNNYSSKPYGDASSSSAIIPNAGRDLSLPTPSSPDTQDQQQQQSKQRSVDFLKQKYPNISLKMIKDVIRDWGGHRDSVLHILSHLSELLKSFPMHDENAALATLETCRFDVVAARQTLSAAVELKKKTDAVIHQFPDHDREIVLDVLEAVDYDVGAACLMLSSPEYAPPTSLDKLTQAFPHYDRGALNDVLDACQHDFSKAMAAMAALAEGDAPQVLHTPDFAAVDYTTPLNIGRAFHSLQPPPPSSRRLLVLLDDSGSMKGRNLQRGKRILLSLQREFQQLPTKVVIFGSRDKVRVVFDWNVRFAEINLQHICERMWLGDSGRTFLWGCLTECVALEENPKDLHVLLITDGEDTESRPPFKGMRGMVPAVKRLNDLGFDGEISLVALGNEIDREIGHQYLALVGATGGAGAVINDYSRDTEDDFLFRFLNTVTIKGRAAQAEREQRLQQYANQVKRGEQTLVPTKVLEAVDKNLMGEGGGLARLYVFGEDGSVSGGGGGGGGAGNADQVLEDLVRAQREELEEKRQQRLREEEELARQRELAERQRQEQLAREEAARQAQLRELERIQREEAERLRRIKEEEERERKRREEEERQRQEQERQRQLELERLEAMRRQEEARRQLEREQREEQERLAKERVAAEELRRLQEQQELEKKRLQAKLEEEERQRQLQREREEAERRRLEEQRRKEEEERERRRKEQEERERELALQKKREEEMRALQLQQERERQKQLEEAEKQRQREEEEYRRKQEELRREEEEAKLKAERAMRNAREQAAKNPKNWDNNGYSSGMGQESINLRHVDGGAQRLGEDGLPLDADLQEAFHKNRADAVEQADRERMDRVRSRLAAEKESALSPELRRLLEHRRRKI